VTLLDGGCFAGHDLATGHDWPIEAVVADFDRRGVRAGLVASWRSLYQDLEAGNREAAAWATRFPGRVIPLAVVHPAYYGEAPEPLMRRLYHQLGFRAVALFSTPSYYQVDWNAPAVRHLGLAAAEAGLALQAGIANDGDLGGVLRTWGNLKTPIMVRWMAGHRYKYIASELAAAAACPQLLLDSSNLCSTGALQLLSERIGSDRLFLASNAPYAIPDCAHAVFDAAELSPADRAAIGGGNLSRALGLSTNVVTVEQTSVPPASAALARLSTRPKVDIHWHPDHWNLGEPALDPMAQVATLDRFGIERVIMFSIRALNDSLLEGNAFTAQWTDREPRAFGMIVIDPLRPAESRESIARWGGHPKFVGLKTIQDVAGLGLDDEAYRPFLEEAERRGFPVLAHLTGMAEAARRHPGVRFIAAHGNWGRARRLADLPNISFDFSTGHANRHETQLARFVEAVGAERVLFGSDAQLVSPVWSLAKLAAAGLDERSLDRILRRNAYQLFPKLAD
jgi:hypothetical protein